MTDKEIRDEALKKVMGVLSHTNNGVTRYIADAVAEQVVRDEAGDTPTWIKSTWGRKDDEAYIETLATCSNCNYPMSWWHRTKLCPSCGEEMRDADM